MKLYRVTLTIDLVVAAASPEEAQSAARDVVDVDDGAEPYASVEEITSRKGLPSGWTVDCIPFGDANDDREIADYLP